MEVYKKFFNLVHEEEEGSGWHNVSEGKNLELTLGPPGEFRGYKNMNAVINGGKRVPDQDCRIFEAKKDWFSNNNNNEKQCNKLSREEKCSSSRSAVDQLLCSDRKKACSSHVTASFPTIARTSGPHKRVASAAVVGWPPIRSFRKNLGSSSNSNLEPDHLPNKTPTQWCPVKKPDSFSNDLFVKINMEGVPFGRKINLNAYDSYERLSMAIDELFRGLLAAQSETCSAMNENKNDEAKTNGGGSGNGEYTLVYEDNEGDRILVGDVPWNMFVSTTKRLRVLKSSQLSTPRFRLAAVSKTP